MEIVQMQLLAWVFVFMFWHTPLIKNWLSSEAEKTMSGKTMERDIRLNYCDDTDNDD